MAHHGMIHLRGINAMCSDNPEHEGRFGRIFGQLSSHYNLPASLHALGDPSGPMDGGGGRNRSNTIPMGFVFFGQFVDHDVTLDTTSGLDRVNDPNATANFRTPSLDLDCIYGSGPEASPYLYKDGIRLLTGADGTALTSQTASHAAEDLVRTSAGTAIIGDPRNDENRIISQLQLAFIRFHNKVVDHLASTTSYTGKELYEEARREVVWHYHWIIINEFLPLMVGQPMVNSILSEGRKFYTPRNAFIPIEFSAAAYRFGHSLTSQRLKVQAAHNPFDLFGGTLGFGFSPIDDDRQVVEWDQLFNLSPGSADTTDKLDTLLPKDLLDLPFINDGSPKSLATRNLLRGQSFLLPSGERVSDAIGVDPAHQATVDNHISNVTAGIDMGGGTPLWFYILAEAAALGRFDASGNQPGEGLGPVGGTIVAETLIGLIEKDNTSYLGSDRSWSPNLAGGNTFTMADLLSF